MKLLNEQKQTWDKNMCLPIINNDNFQTILYFLYLNVENFLPAFFMLFVDLLLKAALHHHLTAST